MYCLQNKMVYVPNTTFTKYSTILYYPTTCAILYWMIQHKDSWSNILRQNIFKRNKNGLLKPYCIIQVTNKNVYMVKCLEHHRITFSFLIIRALLVFFSCLNQMICAPRSRGSDLNQMICDTRSRGSYLNQMIWDKMICDTRSEVPIWIKWFATKWFAIRTPRSRTEPIDSRNAL